MIVARDGLYMFEDDHPVPVPVPVHVPSQNDTLPCSLYGQCKVKDILEDSYNDTTAWRVFITCDPALP